VARRNSGELRHCCKGQPLPPHNKKLKAPEHALDNLLPRAVHLDKKLGPVLFQLPPKWRVHSGRLQNLLVILPSEIRYGFDFRERSGMSAEIFGSLREFNAAFYIYELAGHYARSRLRAVHLRPAPRARKRQVSGKLQRCSEQQLSRWTRQIESWAKELMAIYFYFDNDQAGYAVTNALRLRDMAFGRSAKRAG
jgi:uncharacterized protein YecE (DUF72 family)